MQVRIRVRWAVVVDDNVDTLDIDTTTEDIRRYQDTLLERLERGVTGDTRAE